MISYNSDTKSLGLKSIVFTTEWDNKNNRPSWKARGKLADAVDLPLVVDSNDTARIQECHIFLIHYLAEGLETSLVDNAAS